MKKLLHLFFITVFLLSVTAQSQIEMGKMASLNEDGTISVNEVKLPSITYRNNRTSINADLMFSFGRPASPSFKNSRGTALADLDGDGIEEIIYGMGSTLYAIKGDGTVLWSKPISGTIVSPVAIADVNGDGNPEIALNTWQPPSGGRVYLMDSSGEDLAGWPLNFSNHFMLNSPVLADFDGNGSIDITTCERVSSTVGFVHVLNIDGTSISANFPVEIGATPAFTPSIGDVDNDGENELVIAGSASGMYIFNTDGSLLPGFPLFDPAKRYSYQSPILLDLDGDSDLEIVGSNHGDSPGFYVLNHNATYASGWPIETSGWTYSPPTVADVNGDGTYEIFMADRNTSSDGSPLPVVYGFKPDGTNIDNFPISKYGGNEGVLSIADINNDGFWEIIFTSTLTDSEGIGYIHAYSLDGSGEIDGFPLRPKGFTFLNSAVLGDVDNDGMMDLTANSYTQTFGASIDSTFVNTYNLNVPFDRAKILRNGYKGGNSRTGLLDDNSLGLNYFTKISRIIINPNPSEGNLKINLPREFEKVKVDVFTIDGRKIFSEEKILNATEISYDFRKFSSGIYIVKISDGKKSYSAKWVKQ